MRSKAVYTKVLREEGTLWFITVIKLSLLNPVRIFLGIFVLNGKENAREQISDSLRSFPTFELDF